MSKRPPVDEQLTIDRLVGDPYPIYRKFRAQSPVVHVKSVGRIFLTKAEDTKTVKDNPVLFSSDDPNTPMKRAFNAHTLMRKDGAEHRSERMAMMPAFNPRVIANDWVPLYDRMADVFLDSLPTDEPVDLFPTLAGPLAGRFLAAVMGMPDATDQQMQSWSQILIDGAGNFGWKPELFAETDQANAEMNANLERNAERLRADPDPSALSVMVNAEHPIPWSQIAANVKIAIGGGINEPRDALLTVIFGLLTHPDQLEEVKRTENWMAAFEEAVRWVAPIQASSRLVMEDTQIRDHAIRKGETVMTIQASANRDEDVCEDGEHFNALRATQNHQAFGNGPHHCMGAQISRRTVGAVLLPKLFDRFPSMQLVDPDKVIWRGFGFRGPINMPVVLGAT